MHQQSELWKWAIQEVIIYWGRWSLSFAPEIKLVYMNSHLY